MKYERGLEGCRVLDLADERGAYCGRMLADFGADVVKIEPVTGDLSRNTSPLYENKAGADNSFYFYSLNMNKRGITLNLEDVKGRELFKKLVKSADIVIESFKPGYLAGLGLDYANLKKIKPGLVMTSITPYGQDGPYKDYESSDLVADAMSGWMYMIGDPDRAPLRVGVPQIYLHAGGQAVMATLIAYEFQQTTGKGQYVDVAIHGVITSATFNALGFWELRNQILPRSGPYRQGMSQTTKQQELWKCKDGFVAFILIGGSMGSRQNKRLVEWMVELNEAPDLLREMDWDTFDQANADPAFIASLDEAISSVFMKHTMEEIFDAAKKFKIMLTPINTPGQIMDCPQLAARETWQKVTHPDWGEFMVAKAPPHVSSGSLGFIRHAPRLGEHNHDIYAKELKIGTAEMVSLKEAKVI
ncbi:MAG TPA: CoA transferase [Dehalococcoidales bacterium]|nr:CoA transferase [Dehalococcoidales bacterium]